MNKPKVGVLVSGRGSNLQALIDAVARGELQAELAVVISNHPNAYALRRAADAGIPTVVVPRQDHPSRAAQQMAMADELERRGVSFVVLAGFDRVVLPAFVDRFPWRMINIHPSLLPAFGGGLHAQADALAYGVKVSGCTVHFVTGEVDVGPIILQVPVPVEDDDTVDSLAARILEQEHLALPKAVDLLASGRLVVENRRVRILPSDRS